MVWHTYMLNPRAYLEDCLRGGHMALWHTGMPWHAIAPVINSETFDYTPSATARGVYPILTGDAWDAEDGPQGKEVSCTKCAGRYTVPWTTYSTVDLKRCPGELKEMVEAAVASGSGYADKGFKVNCDSCGRKITHDGLTADKFFEDVHALLERDIAMPGTLLGFTGIPSRVDGDRVSVKDTSCENYMTFPNKMLKAGLGQKLIGNATNGMKMNDIKEDIEIALTDKSFMKQARESWSGTPLRQECIYVRKMMSRYWNNPSPFALDLVGAVVRQGGFIEKMHGIDWLHSPALHNTMTRLIVKYQRFFEILKPAKG